MIKLSNVTFGYEENQTVLKNYNLFYNTMNLFRNPVSGICLALFNIAWQAELIKRSIIYEQ